MNAVVNLNTLEDIDLKLAKVKQAKEKSTDTLSEQTKPNELAVDETREPTYEDYEQYFLPYTGNGYFALSVDSMAGLYALNHQHAPSFALSYSPLTQIYSDILVKKG
jgi:hypothetical protein